MDLILSDPVFLNDMVEAALAGQQFRITEDDYQGIRLLMIDDRPSYRRAGVILAAQTAAPALRRDIVLATADADEATSAEALLVIQNNPRAFQSTILDVLEETSHRITALSLFSVADLPDAASIAVGFFDDPNPDVRDEASLVFNTVADRSHPALQRALDSADGLTASMAYRTLGRYGHVEDLPLFIEAFTHADPDIRRESQLAALRVGEAGLAPLHAEALNPAASQDSRLAALNVLQGIRSEESLRFLFSLLNAEQEFLRVKVESILSAYDEQAIPELESLYRQSAANIRIHAVRLMGSMGAVEALPILTDALGDAAPEVRETARDALMKFGQQAWPSLRRQVVEGGGLPRNSALSILLWGGDPWLIKQDNGESNREAMLLMITISRMEEMAVYVDAAGLSPLEGEAVLSLKEAWVAAEEFAALSADIADDAYLSAWREREILEVDARDALMESFNSHHEYFATEDAGALDKAQALRTRSRELEKQAQLQTDLINRMSAAERTRGEEKLNRYRELRDSLVRVWEHTIPELRPLAEDVFADRGLDPRDLSKESALLR